jgi:hypothetical protein
MKRARILAQSKARLLKLKPSRHKFRVSVLIKV